MKNFVFLSLLICQSAVAMPIVCESLEKSGETPTVRLKINPKEKVVMDGSVWNYHLLGITSQGQMRELMHGTSSPTDSSIKMTVVEGGSVLGYIDAASPEKNGRYDGELRIGGIQRGKVLAVHCFDEQVHGVIGR